MANSLRMKTKTKQKTTTPVRLTHDGPIFNNYCCSKRIKDSTSSLDYDNQYDNQNENQKKILKYALKILEHTDTELTLDIDDDEERQRLLGKEDHNTELVSTWTKDCIKNNGSNSKDIVNRIYNLCRDLRKPENTSKEQLNALQTFRSTILNKRKQNSQKFQQSATNENTFENNENILIVLGWNRILLEWSLSYETPLTFQRAIQSNIKAIETLQILNRDDAKDRTSVDTSLRLLYKDVLQSILHSTKNILSEHQHQHGQQQSMWKNPIHSLDVAVNNSSLLEILQTELLVETLTYLNRLDIVSAATTSQSKQNSAFHQDELTNLQIESALQVITISKHLLTGLEVKDVIHVNSAEPNDTPSSVIIYNFEKLQDFVNVLLSCSNIPNEGFNTLGILYGKLWYFIQTASISKQTIVSDDAKDLSILTALSRAYIEGMARLGLATLSSFSQLARLLIVQGIFSTLDIETLLLSIPQQDATTARTSSFIVCWKYTLNMGRSSVDPMVRWAALKGLSALTSRWNQYQHQVMHGDSINVIGPTNREPQQQFEKMIEETLEFIFNSWENPPMRKIGTTIPGLFTSVVQLVNEAALPGLFRQVLDQPVNRKGRYLALEILLPYIYAKESIQNGNETVDYSNIIPLDSLLEGIGDKGPNAGAIADLWVKILKYEWNNRSQKHITSSVFEDWMLYWVPAMSEACLALSLTRRKQVTAFCIPRVVELFRNDKILKQRASQFFVYLLREIFNFSNSSTEKSLLHDDALESILDRVLWAQLEIVRYAAAMKVDCPELKDALIKYISKKKLRHALVHSLPSIRIAGFQAMNFVLSTHASSSNVECEVEMWKSALPFTIKTNTSKEYQTTLLQHLYLFLDRLLNSEAEGLLTSKDTPLFLDFCVSFLVKKLVLTLASYPGTVAEKEIFGVTVLNCLLAFSLQNEAYSGSNEVAKNGAIFNRKRTRKESAMTNVVLEELMDQEVFSSQFALLHSVVDRTRTVTYTFLAKLLAVCQIEQLTTPEIFTCNFQRQFIVARGINLASSPRQREANTGARILAITFASLASRQEKSFFLFDLAELTKSRLSSMKTILANIMSGGHAQTSDFASDGFVLPLAHGIIHATRLCLEQEDSGNSLLVQETLSNNATLLESMIEIFCQALQISLSIVADVKVGKSFVGIDDDTSFTIMDGLKPDSTPLNVNTGAIGANGTFSSVSNANDREKKARVSTQRIVIGSWLLTKESCAAISAVLTVKGYQPVRNSICKAGQLLLSTLSTLKHAGAAFAARDSLQQIATACLGRQMALEIQSLPQEWSNCLFDEISLSERVKNSTLRRSTGYALGFLALMRAKISSKSMSDTFSRSIMERLVLLSLPPQQELTEAFSKLNIVGDTGLKDSLLLPSILSSVSWTHVPEHKYETRSRIHALNVLRMIIMDAPLASQTSAFIGDAIVSAILGYDDPSWAVRNSSTMVFAATMLRVVDADKNALTGDKTATNAITIAELFRRYPFLSSFLPSFLGACLEDSERGVKERPQVFPILLLLSRVQQFSDSDSNSNGSISELFVPLLIRCLGSRDTAIRHAAARSLANLTSDESRPQVVAFCVQRMEAISVRYSLKWNELDGLLLAIEAVHLLPNKSPLSDQLQASLFSIANGKFPPTCRATSLSILLKFSVTYNDKFFSCCVQVLNSEELDSVIGGSTLRKTASEELCKILQTRLWEPADESSFQEALEGLSKLFASNSIDVRLYAVKCFKKGLYNNLQNIGFHSDISAFSPEVVIGRLTIMLLDCVESELGRESSNTLGAHIPTLRRLSRCFLECIYKSNSTILIEKHDVLWSISCKIIRQDFPSGVVVESDFDGAEIITSNAVEMMAIAISLVHKLNANENKDSAYILDRLQMLLTIIDNLNHPYAFWRSRYSAAIALDICYNVFWTKNSEVSGTKPKHQSLQRKATIHILQMLQDSDPDVRRVAVKVATKISHGIERQKDENRLLPEWTLQRLFPIAFDASNEGDINSLHQKMEDLVGIILDNCIDLVGTVKHVQKEFQPSQECLSSEAIFKAEAMYNLVNVNTERKIFEDEDPNPFQESLLLNQIAIRSLHNLTTKTESPSMLSNAFRVLDLCNSSLLLLLGTVNEGGFIHEITRFPSVFPCLYSVLCTTVVLIQTFDSNDKQWQKKEEKISILLESIQVSAKKLVEEGKHLHPSVFQALNLLKEPIQNEKQFAGQIDDFLFLSTPCPIEQYEQNKRNH